MIGDPPLLRGAPNERTIKPLPAAAFTLSGAPGGPAGVMAPGKLAPGPVPAALVAAIEHSYAVPFVRPANVIGLDALVAVFAPGLQANR